MIREDYDAMVRAVTHSVGPCDFASSRAQTLVADLLMRVATESEVRGIVAGQQSSWLVIEIQARLDEAADRARKEDRAALDEVFPMLDWLLVRIGSWTSARWDQHLRDQFGDERAQKLIDVLAAIRARGMEDIRA